MHAAPHENLFGVVTHYGTHPKQPASWSRRLRHGAHEVATWVVATGLLAKKAAQKLRD